MSPPLRCLVVDDSRPVRRIVRRMLEAAGEEVAEAEDGVVGLVACRAARRRGNEPDLLVAQNEKVMQHRD